MSSAFRGSAIPTWALALLSVVGLGLAARSPASAPQPLRTQPAALTTSPVAAAHPVASKLMVIVDENHGYSKVIDNAHAPYLSSLAKQFGTSTNFYAGYPVACPSLGSYILLTSGSSQGICDDKPPASHPLTVNNIFRQTLAAGKTWRDYAESMPANCTAVNSANGQYMVRHAPAPYYTPDRAACRTNDVPLGSTRAGALVSDVQAGRLPAYALVTPNACHDMHGYPSCPSGNLVAQGDTWLHAWLPKIMAGPDYRSGRLAVVITFDEGGTDNHIPAVVISQRTTHVVSNAYLTNCSILRTAEDIIGAPPLGCAASSPSLVGPFRL